MMYKCRALLRSSEPGARPGDGTVRSLDRDEVFINEADNAIVPGADCLEWFRSRVAVHDAADAPPDLPPHMTMDSTDAGLG